jgi:hypothetical protein
LLIIEASLASAEVSAGAVAKADQEEKKSMIIVVPSCLKTPMAHAHARTNCISEILI